MTVPQLDLFAAKAKRDKAIRRVVRNQDETWKQLYRHHAVKFLESRIPIDLEFTGEDLRIYLEPIIGRPTHHNAWGGMASGVLRGWLRDKKITEGGMAHMKGARSHARRTPLYHVNL